MAEQEWRIIVPTMDNSGYPIKTQVLQTIADEVARFFGGVTVYPAAGCYDKDGQLLCDTNMVVTASQVHGLAGPSVEEGNLFMQDLAKRLGQKLGQYDVMDQTEPLDLSEFVAGDYKAHVNAKDIEPRMPRTGQVSVLGKVLGRG